MTLQPFRRAVARALFGEIGTDTSSHAVQLVAAAASLSLKKVTPLGELRHIGHVAFLVAAAAGGTEIFR